MHQNKNQNTNKQHEPVLLSEVLSYLDPKKGDSLLDVTAGYGGHSQAILERTGSLINSVLVDRDEAAIKQLKKLFGNAVELVKSDFYSASQQLVKANRQFDLILVDLGVSSPHLNEGKRGFSFNNNGPLDMRMDESQTLTAHDIVNGLSEADLAHILKAYGEEPKADKIAHLIVQARPLDTTEELASVVKRAWPEHRQTHPATKTFQAVRVAVNDELRQLAKSLPLWIELLSPGGRIVVISYHSLEDRIVKQAFKEASSSKYESKLTLLNKKPLTPSPHEIAHNPRARSAKLRSAVKIKKKGN